jgi:hypothetical protein
MDGLGDQIAARLDATAATARVGLATRNRSDFEPVRSLRLREL